jgi:hypothetical protein
MKETKKKYPGENLGHETTLADGQRWVKSALERALSGGL